ncbi:MAG: hypothetical protein ABI907_04630 [Ramlibacter sp.]
MSLIKKLFGRSPASAAPAVESSTFHESETTTEQGSRNAPRRELVQVVLRDTMRRHGIPSAWIDCRILSVVSRSNATGMHVQLVVRDGEDRLLAYVPAFQSSFLQGIEKFEPKCSEWLLSLSWQFPGISSSTPAMPDPAAWEPPHGTTSEEDEIMKDVQALFAIRDAAINAPQPLKETADFEETRPVAGDSR